MKYLLASDIHGDALACKFIVDEFNNGNYDKLTNNAKAMELYNTFLKDYPRDDYVPRIYNNFVNITVQRFSRRKDYGRRE